MKNYKVMGFCTIFLLSLGARANICSRTTEVVNFLEQELKKSCAEITPAELETLTELDMSNLKISSIQKSDFVNLVNVTLLDLSENTITELAPDVFDELLSLQDLYLYTNRIRSLPASLLNNLIKLKTINLAMNEITDVPLAFFDKNESLQYVSLSTNKISYLSDNIFRNNKSLDTVALDRNPILKLPASFFDLTNVDRLAIDLKPVASGDYLRLPKKVVIFKLFLGQEKVLPEDFFQQEHEMEELFIFGPGTGAGGLSELPSQIFHGLNKLFWLAIQSTAIETLQADRLVGLNLTRLSLTHNQIKSLPANLLTAKQLTNINICDNKLTALPAEIFQKIPLKYLWMGKNSFPEEEKLRIINSLPDANVDSDDSSCQ